MSLLKLPKVEPKAKASTKSGSAINLKKGQSIDDLIAEAKKLVEEKLGKYKETSKCVTDIDSLKQFFNETDDLIRNRYRNHRFKYFY